MEILIRDVEILPLVLPKDDPKWRFALGGEPQAKGFIVKIHGTDGTVGLGYAGVATHHGETQEGVKAALETYAGVIKGLNAIEVGKIINLLEQHLPGNNAAQAGIDLALHDLTAKVFQVPLYQLLGGRMHHEIPVMRILALKEPEEMAANALKLKEAGFRYIKVKFEGDPTKDLARLREIRKAVGEEIHLMVDMNQSYTAKQAIATLKRAEPYRIDICEQPVRADDWEGLNRVTREAPCIVEAHESALSLKDIFFLVKGRIVDSINLKIGQVGGIRKAQIAAALCKWANVALRTGTTGSALSSAFSLHFTTATENIAYACELGEFARLLNDPVSGLEVKEGMLTAPEHPGVGVFLQEGTR